MDRRTFIKNSGLKVGGAVSASALLAAPAIAQSRTHLTVVSTWPRDYPGLGTSAQRLCSRIPEISDGRIEVDYFAAGERVGAFDCFDEVASGNSQAYLSADYYWKGKDPGWSYFTSVPFGLTYTEMDAWIMFGGGQELWDKLAGEFGLKNFAAGNAGFQMGGWFNKEIETADDLKGLKMRIPGQGGDVMAKLGAAPVSLPGGQIYENLVSGAIDAAEWVGPWNDYYMKFYEAAKYYYWPGFHEPGAQVSMGFNASWFGALSKANKEVLRAACAEENAKCMAESNTNNQKYLEILVREHGVQLRQFSDEIYDSFGKASNEVLEEVRDHSPLASEITESFTAARKSGGNWMSIAEVAFINQRNRVLGE